MIDLLSAFVVRDTGNVVDLENPCFMRVERYDGPPKLVDGKKVRVVQKVVQVGVEYAVFDDCSEKYADRELMQCLYKDLLSKLHEIRVCAHRRQYMDIIDTVNELENNFLGIQP